MKHILLISICILAVTGCNQIDDSAALGSGINTENMDLTVRPQDDFFTYVNGTWMENTEIPADQTSTGAMRDLRDKAREDVKGIIEEVSSSTDLNPGSDEQKVADLYRSFMDTEALDDLAITPLEAEFRAIDQIANKKELSAYLAHLMKIGGGGPFVGYINNDGKDSTRYAAHLYQSGLGLPDRDYYFNDSERFGDLRTAYLEHIEKMFELAELADPAASAAMLMALETRLAEYHWTRVESRDRDKTYNKIAFSDLGTLGEGIEWSEFIAAAGIDGETDIIINQPTYISGLNTVFTETSLEDLQTYLKWNVLNTYAGYLDARLDQQNFEFYSRTLSGQEEQLPRWKRGTDVVSGSLGEVIGKIYVSRHFGPEAKARMVELVENLRAAYGEAINELEWMSPDTKAAAQIKLARFTPKIGYPDLWEDYSKLEIAAGDLVGNIMRANQFQYELEVSKLGGPIRTHEWGMTPQTVNAYYNPAMNEVVFPAAILQPPFFNMEADDAVNYGAIGTVIGHEMGHGFDDQGSKYDADGNLQNWWTDSDREEFKVRTQALVDQYSQFAVFEDLNVNGELTLGENIGDLAGLTIAYRAYQRSLDGKEAPVIDGMTGAQRFFVGIGQVWRYKITEEALRNRVATDPHSPAMFRILGPLPNMPEFHEAFDVKEGDEMYLAPDQRVKIW